MSGQESRGLLYKANTANIGKSRVISPLVAPAGAPLIIVQDFDLMPAISAAEQFDSENMTLAVSSYQLTNSTVGTADQILVQGVLSFNNGSSLFGSAQDPTVALPTVALSQEIVFDIQAGTTILVPAASAAFLRIRYTAVRLAGFVAGAILGPDYRINAGFSYNTPKSFKTTRSEPIRTIANGNATVVVAKPPFAQSVSFMWSEYIGGGVLGAAVGPLGLEFLNFPGTGIVFTTQIPTGAGTPIVPPEIPWPEDSPYVLVTNQDAANPMTFFKAVHQLVL